MLPPEMMYYYGALNNVLEDMGWLGMKDFPEFMKSKKNLIGTKEQNTQDIEGYFFVRGGRKSNGDLDYLFR